VAIGYETERSFQSVFKGKPPTLATSEQTGGKSDPTLSRKFYFVYCPFILHFLGEKNEKENQI
jgi:hypothetical protein